MALKLKTVAGLLLVVIACLVVGMLGYNLVEGLTPGQSVGGVSAQVGVSEQTQPSAPQPIRAGRAVPSKFGARPVRINDAVSRAYSQQRNRARNQNTASTVSTSVGVRG